MTAKTPIRTVFDGDGNATGLAEFQSGEFVGLTHGGIGASLSIGTAGQVLKVNSGATALEFGSVEAIVNIDGATNLESATLASTDKFLVSDGGTEGRATLAQIATATKDTTVTLTNKTLSGASNTFSNIPTSAISFSGSTISGITNLTAGGINIVGNSITSADSTVIQMGESLSITGSLTQSGNTITLGTNTSGRILVADGSGFTSQDVTSLAEISTVANDDVFLAIDTSGGGLKKIARSAVVSGLASSSAISNVVEDTTPQLGGDLDAQGNDVEDVGYYSHRSPDSTVTQTLAVTVVTKTTEHTAYGDGSANGYAINGHEGPVLQLSQGVYKFDQADSSNSGHPLRFYDTADKNAEYTTNVTTSGTPGQAGAHTTITVTKATPSVLHYQCSAHANMGSVANVVGSESPRVTDGLSGESGVNLTMPSASGTIGTQAFCIAQAIALG